MIMQTSFMTLGIDLGGTQIRAARILPHGRVDGYVVSMETRAGFLPGEAIYERIRQAAQQAIGEEEIAAVGIGSTGPLDINRGMTLDCNNLPSLQYFPLCERLAADLGKPVFLNNDANALILGEAAVGAGQGKSRVLGLTLGTGLGAALVVDLHVVRGARDNAGEIWTAPYGDGIIEDVLSGTGVQNMYASLTGKNLQGREIARLAREGDPQALSVWERFADALGFTLSWTVNMDDPDIVVLGGSVVASADLFLARAEERMRRYICKSTSENIRVVTARLGGDAGVIGAGIDARVRYLATLSPAAAADDER